MIGTQAGLSLAGQGNIPRLSYAAKRAGYKEIEIHLRRDAHHQSAGQITGCKILKDFEAGRDHNNLPTFDFVVSSGDISFAFDEEKGDVIAYLFDDEERGTVSPVGYNRDLLASHIDLFDVPDPEIAADIAMRAEKSRARAAEKDRELEGKEPSEDLAGENVEDLDAQIKRLQARKMAALNKPPKSTAPVHGNKPPEVKKKPPKSSRPKKTPAERKAWGEEMKRRREAKKAERAAGIADVPKEENAVHETNSEVGAANS